MNIYVKNLKPEEKLSLSLKLYYSARELKKQALLKFYPEMTENEVKERIKKIFLYARS